MKGLNHKQQSGVVLFMSLVMLLILTLLGLSSVQNTNMQRIMSRNARDAELAFQSAETAVREAEAKVQLLTNTVPFETGNTVGNYNAVVDGVVVLKDFKWDAGAGVVAAPENTRAYSDVATTIVGVAGQPSYFVEFYRTVISQEDRLNLDNIGQDTGAGRTQVFRVTAHGTGGTDAAQVLIQTTYGKKF